MKANNGCLSLWFLKPFLYRAAQLGSRGEHVPHTDHIQDRARPGTSHCGRRESNFKSMHVKYRNLHEAYTISQFLDFNPLVESMQELRDASQSSTKHVHVSQRCYSICACTHAHTELFLALLCGNPHWPSSRLIKPFQYRSCNITKTTLQERQAGGTLQ